MALPKPTPVSVTEINRKAKSLLENQLGEVCVEAEISNLSRPSSGHWYFTLKDDRAQLSCAMFRRANMRVGFEPKLGDSVIVRGLLSIYEARGNYQLMVDHMEASGDGALQRALDALKKKLQSEGLFEQDRKKAIPPHCERIGVITSPTGAAVEDIISVLGRRSPSSHIAIYPAQVQGTGSAAQIAGAIDAANAQVRSGERTLDVLIVGRGGGSLEDLWAFNEEIVARAIARSEIPVVSAVGHEIDYSISDLVADLRAATPSQAAELVTRDSQEWLQRIDITVAQLESTTARILRDHRQRTESLTARLRHPSQQLALLKNKMSANRDRATMLIQGRLTATKHPLAQLTTGLHAASPNKLLKQRQEKINSLSNALPEKISKVLQDNKRQVDHFSILLETIGPSATLKRGYAIVTDQSGKVVRSATQAEPGKSVEVTLHRGRLRATVDAIDGG